MGVTALVSAGLLSAALSAVSPRWELGLRTEARYRHVELASGDQQQLGQLEVRPAGRLQLVAPGWELTAWYAPRLALADRAVDRTLVHEASLVLRWPLGTWEVTPSLTGSYGRFNTFQLLVSGAQPGQSQALPWATTVLAASAQAQLAVVGRPAARYRLEGAVAAYLDGGDGPLARLTLPMQRGLRARALLEWQATHLGTLTSSLVGTLATFSTGPDVAFVVWSEGWRQRVSRELELWLAAGASATQQRRDGAVTVTTLPSGEVGAGYHVGVEDQEQRARLAITLAPAVDRVSGQASQRLGVAAGYQLELGRLWHVLVEAGGGVVVRGDLKRDQAWGGTLSVGRSLGEQLLVEAGLRGYDQRQPRSDQHGAEWVAFVGLSALGKGKLPTVALP